MGNYLDSIYVSEGIAIDRKRFITKINSIIRSGLYDGHNQISIQGSKKTLIILADQIYSELLHGDSIYNPNLAAN